MLFDGLLIEHQCRPQAVAAAGTSGTIVYRNLFLSSLLGRPIQCLSVLTGMEDRSGGHVGQSDRVLSDGIRLHQAKRGPGTGEVGFTGAEHKRTKVQAILVNETR